MVEANIVLTLLQTVSIMVGIGYYILNIQNNQKNQELTLKSQKQAEDTRKIQILHDINEWTTEDDSNLNWNEMMNMEWDDYDNFNSKYTLEKTPDQYNGRVRIWRKLNLYGLLIDDGLIEARAGGGIFTQIY